jgi:hypothetical protein
VTIDLDTTDVEVYGRHKRGVAYNHQGQRVARPHVACWADAATVLAADLLAGNEDPRRDAPALLRRTLAALPAVARTGPIRLRADAGYFAGQLARAVLFAEVDFAIRARRIAHGRPEHVTRSSGRPAGRRPNQPDRVSSPSPRPRG